MYRNLFPRHYLACYAEIFASRSIGFRKLTKFINSKFEKGGLLLC